jgi:N-acetylmuramoyl-L-alanine amidase
MAGMSKMSGRILAAAAILIAAVLCAPAGAEAQSAQDQYMRALARERAVRDAGTAPTLKQLHDLVAAYERVVHRFPRSGYSDNALWQASNLSLLAYQQFGRASDKRTGQRLLKQLKSSYPSSSLLERYEETLAYFDEPLPARQPAKPAVVPAVLPRPRVEPAGTDAGGDSREVSTTGQTVAIRGITRTPLPDGLRVSIEMDGEIAYHQEQLANPSRLFFDLRNARPVASLLDATLEYPGDIVKEIRLGRHPQNTTRVVMDMNGVEAYSVFTLYNPYRVVIDFRRTGAPPPAPAILPRVAAASPAPASLSAPLAASVATSPVRLPEPGAPPPAAAAPIASVPLAARGTEAPALPAPAVPSANSNGKFSIARQLGLGVSRVVIDAGHGGHDPGASAYGLQESDLVLDVALRLKKLLEAQPGFEVVMTRDTDVFIPLEERTAIANRESADLFLSIHANASRNRKAHGVETYFLNFASNPDASAVAARENSASGKTMHSLPEIVKAITLNNKIDESRDFASIIQKSMVKKLAAKNDDLKDLGVKQAPFVVLIGAGMPSVLAEISFVTHKEEGRLLKTPAYRQQIAEALFEGVQGYQKSLKARSAIALKDE